jgi:hypothetical protein
VLYYCIAFFKNHASGDEGHEEESQGHRQNDNQGDNNRVERNAWVNTKEGEKPKTPPTTTQQSEVDEVLAELKMKMATMEKKKTQSGGSKQAFCGNGDTLHQASG